MVAILEHMTALSDPTRCRMLLLLERHELTVSEICAVLQMPQSSVSRHLKTLADDDWVTSRRDGTSRFYTMPVDDLDAGAKRLWPLIREQVAATSAAGQDDRRLKGVLTRRRAKSQEFFATAAGGWDRLRSDLFGDTFFLWGVLGLIDPSLVVGDLGCGTGQLTETIAPYVKRVISVDGSVDMLDAARQRVGNATNVDLRQGDLENLPLTAGELDAAMLSLVLHYSPSPARALAESRTRDPQGRPRAGRGHADRTSVRSISSRWGTCGSASPRSRSRGSSTEQDSATSACGRCRPIPTPAARRCSPRSAVKQ